MRVEDAEHQPEIMNKFAEEPEQSKALVKLEIMNKLVEVGFEILSCPAKSSYQMHTFVKSTTMSIEHLHTPVV